MAIPSLLAPVLFIGGSGAVGRHATRALRDLQPALPLTVGGRDLVRATSLAESLGRADAASLDLARADLGLGDRRFSAVVSLLRDDHLAGLRYALDRGLPFISFSDFVFDIGPAVAQTIHTPPKAPVMLLGQYLGGTATLLALHAAQDFRRVDRIAIAGLLDEDDQGGPVAQADFARLAQSPRAMILKDGRFAWAEGADLRRDVVDRHGVTHTAEALPLLDVPSLAAATSARDIRVDLALRPVGADRGPVSHEMLVDLEGEGLDGQALTRRIEVTDPAPYSAMSGRGAALAVESLLGLAGAAAPGARLRGVETTVDPARAVTWLQRWGTTIRVA